MEKEKRRALRLLLFDLIEKECLRQEDKWGFQKHDPRMWLTILMEEIGEVARAILEGDWDAMRSELIQCAAVIVSWLTSEENDKL